MVDSLAGSYGIFGSYTYLYDAQKRVSHFVDSSGTEIHRFIKYSYNGMDTLPYKSVEYNWFLLGNNPPDTISTFYYYDLQGRNLKDSIITQYIISNLPTFKVDTIYYVRSYQYAGFDKYRKGINKETNGTILFETTDTARIDGAGNVLANKSGPYFESFTYDDHPNPFAKLSNFRTLPAFPQGNKYYANIQSKNNCLKSTLVYGSYTTVEDFTGKYQYNSRNYPQRVIWEESPGSGEYFIYDFKYRSL